jgi:hypothetical protein
MRTGTKLNDGGPYRNMFFVSVTYNNDLAPFQGASAGWAVPRVENPGLKSCSPSGAINYPKSCLSSSILANRLDSQSRTSEDRDNLAYGSNPEGKAGRLTYDGRYQNRYFRSIVGPSLCW